MLGILLFILAIVVGYFEGLAKASRPVVFATAIAFLLISNGLAAQYYYKKDGGTWIITYLSSLLETGIASILVHVLPFYLVYLIVARKDQPGKR